MTQAYTAPDPVLYGNQVHKGFYFGLFDSSSILLYCERTIYRPFPASASVQPE